MSEPNPKCDPAAGGCKHPWSLHRKKKGQPCAAMGCRCTSFVGETPKKAGTKK